LINLINVKKNFKIGVNRTDVLRGISLNVSNGEFVMITGKSGAGKSTLLHILGCLDKPTEGEYRYYKNCISDMQDKEITAIRNNDIGYIFQDFNLIARDTVLKNIEKPLVYQGLNSRERVARSKNALHRVGLESYGNHLPSQLSGGQQQRVAVARAIVTNPSLIIADEPTGSLDSITGQKIIDILRQTNDGGVTVVMVTHDNSLIQPTDTLIKLADGLLVNI